MKRRTTDHHRLIEEALTNSSDVIASLTMSEHLPNVMLPPKQNQPDLQA